MRLYSNAIILGITGTVLLAFTAMRMLEPYIAFSLSVFIYIIFLFIIFANLKVSVEKETGRETGLLKQKYENRIRRLKNEQDTTTLEKTIRNGTKTLIKNAVDYYKIENIKNEMPPSAAIQNLQLDKYGQIIELLADFSLILPDYEENQQIVQQEIRHQIDIFQIDEKAFADFLRSIMDKYLLTVNKKIREMIRQNSLREMKTCPKCKERIPASAKICRHCSYGLTLVVSDKKEKKKKFSVSREWSKKGKILLQKGRLDEAVIFYTKLIDMDPRAGDAYYARGLAFQKKNDESRAIEDLKTAVHLGHGKAKELLNSITFSRTQDFKTEDV